MMRKLVLLMCALSLTACTTVREYLAGEDNSLPPTPLTEFSTRATVKEAWTVSVGDGVGKQFLKLAPAYADGRVYAADAKGRVLAIDATHGRTVWKAETEAPVSGGVGVGEGLVLLGTSDGRVIALGDTDGANRWQAQVSSEVLSVPRAGSGVVVVHCIDGRLYGLDVDSGERLWVYDRTTPLLTLRGNSSPLIADDRVINGFDNGKLVALALADGKTLWEGNVAVPQGRSELDRLVDIDADPELSAGIVYVVSFQGRIAALALDTGRVQWVRDMSSFAGLGLDYVHVYLTDDESQVWALDQNGGGGLWKQDQLKGRMVTAPAAFDDYVVVGDFEGYVHWLSQDDGSFVARVHTDKSGFIMPPVAAGDVLLTYNRSGRLTAYRVAP